jgi:hypothetical protein
MYKYKVIPVSGTTSILSVSAKLMNVVLPPLNPYQKKTENTISAAISFKEYKGRVTYS